ncbi:MAG: DEAD/DEAH box helicase [Nanoarchaeota archaeon]|nr:DEAD/DEAH box helicase [Nanoarchaeota archaeon]
MTTFNELGIDKEILVSLDRLGFTTPTEIQRKAIPLVLEGKDMIAGSATGSGKTLAFGLGILQKIHKGAGIQALILTPTRELADQILKSLKDVSKERKLVMTSVYGGVSINPQIKILKSADIVVGTPGRILDHLSQGTIDLSAVKHVILDEADRMLDMGFLDDVTKIISQCPKKERQMLLFSATLPPEVARLSKRFMDDPVKVDAVKHVDPRKLNQVYYDVTGPLKFSLLAHLLKKEDTGLVMVFCNSRQYTDTVANNLNKVGIEAMAIHGGLTQQKRTQVLSKFNTKTTFVLVCTDVAARGLDIPGVSHVYNYDIPQDSKQYIHRIGRTARAGKSGEVINLISSRDYDYFDRVLRDNDLTIKKMERPYLEKLDLPQESRSRGGFGGRGDGRSSGRSGDRRDSGNYRKGPRSDDRSPRNYGGSRSGGRSGSRGSDRSDRPSSEGGRSNYRSGDRSSDRSGSRSGGSRSSGGRGYSSGNRSGSGRPSERRPRQGGSSQGRSQGYGRGSPRR